MTDPDTLHSLLERLEKAEGPDRKIDHMLCLMKGWNWLDDEIAPNYTASLDDAIALVEKMLPNFYWQCHNDEFVFAVISRKEYNRVAYAPTPVLALLTAMVKALIAETEK